MECVPTQGSPSSSSENSSTGTKELKATATVAGIQNLIAGTCYQDVELEDAQPCILSLIRFSLCELCSTSDLLERMIALAQLKATNGDWIQVRTMWTNIYSEINSWGPTGSSGVWLSLVAAAKMFGYSSFDSEQHALAVASAVKAGEMCLSVQKLGDSDDTAKQTLLSQEIPDVALDAAVHAATAGTNQFEELAHDEPRCQAWIECIVRLFHLGCFGERKETDKELVTARPQISATILEYTSLLVPMLEKMAFEVAKGNNRAEFQKVYCSAI